MARRPPAETVEEMQAVLPDADPEQLRKVAALRAARTEPWPYSFGTSGPVHKVAEAIRGAFQPGEKGNQLPKRWKIAGRLRAKRQSGGIAFLDVEGEGGKVQAVLDKAELGDRFDAWVHLVTDGDWVGVSGYGMRTRRGEPSIGVEKLQLLAKAVLPIPDPRSPLSPELRYGKPYLNLMMGPAERDVLRKRHAITRSLRDTLEKEGFIEAAIPVLERMYGGANAQPFTTHSNAKDMTLYLRISHELALKKLLVGGIEKVYHVGPAFRNEDIDTTHNPEFTLLECYAAYWDYRRMMRLTERLLRRAVEAVAGKAILERPGKEPVDFGKPFAVVTMKDAIRRHGGMDPDALADEDIQRILDGRGVRIRGGYTRGLGIAKLFETFAEAKLLEPTFVIDHPRETTPLCKPHRKDPALVERFELYIDGREHANAYSELNDPVLQVRLFKQQEARRQAGDDEAPPTDTDFLEAIQYGMPPAGGLGIGVDRLVMTLLGIESIKAVLPFPQVK